MREALLLATALAANFIGLACLALAMDTHWRQVRGHVPLPPPWRLRLRIGGIAALTVALWLCVRVDHPSIAVLVWIMALAAAALAIAFILAYRPRTFSLRFPTRSRR
jgi:hypothetical protein